jgi:hypothetical protein
MPIYMEQGKIRTSLSGMGCNVRSAVDTNQYSTKPRAKQYPGVFEKSSCIVCFDTV